MFGRSRSPIEDEGRLWLDEAMAWLIGEFRLETARDGPVVVPTDEYFPDRYDGSEDALETLVARVSEYMRVPRERFDLQVFTDGDSWLMKARMVTESTHEGAAGLYFAEDGERLVLALEESRLDDPTAVVATTAHELAHIHLLADRRLKADDPSHEYYTDLLTVYFGLGVFTANTAVQFSQWEEGGWQGWKASAAGYLGEGEFGYALALLAMLRNETKPQWADFLTSNVAHYFKRSARYLRRNPPPFATGLTQ